MTKDEQDLVKVGVQAALQPFSDLCQKLFGGVAQEVGETWRDAARARRIERRIKLFKRLQTFFDQTGVTPSQIPDNIWMPALEAASTEDDSLLQSKWAALLYNAARVDVRTVVQPSYSEILRQLSPLEAKFLDSIVDYAWERFNTTGDGKHGVYSAWVAYDESFGSEEALWDIFVHRVAAHRLDDPTVLTRASTTGDESEIQEFWKMAFGVAKDNLIRNRLISIHYRSVATPGKAHINGGIGATSHAFLTKLGFNFIKATESPQPRVAATP